MRRARALLSFAIIVTAVAMLGAAEQQICAVIVNAENPVSELTRLEVKKRFLRREARWEGGEKVRPVEIKSSAVQKRFLSKILRMSQADLKRHWIQLRYQLALSPATVTASEAEAIRFVAAEKGGIGFVTAGVAREASGVKVVLLY